MLNKIILMGRLTRDPELRRTESGTAVCSFSIAVDRDFKSKNGEKETDFIDIVSWRATAEFVSKYFTKGRMAVVEAGSRSATGRIRKAASAAVPKSLQTMSTSEIPSRKTAVRKMMFLPIPERPTALPCRTALHRTLAANPGKCHFKSTK